MKSTVASAWLLFAVLVIFAVVGTMATEKVDAEADDEQPTAAPPPPGANGDANGEEPKEGAPCKGHGTRKALKSTNCETFSICNAGLIVYEKCPEGTVFNDHYSACQFPNNKDGGCPTTNAGGKS